MALRPDELKDRLLEQSNFLRGVAFDGLNGPYECSRQAAQLRPDAMFTIQTSQRVSVEDIYPSNEVDARLIHLGWPALSELPALPWDILRPKPQPPPSTSTWVSRHMLVHRWKISLCCEDLIAIDPFIEAVETAVKDSDKTTADKIRALRCVFGAWGEMVPLVAVVGASLVATGTLASNQSLMGDSSSFRPSDRGPDLVQIIDRSLDITGNFERRLESRFQGGCPNMLLQSGLNAWLTSVTNTDSLKWEVVKVYRAAPITALLPEPLRQDVEQLFSYTNLVSRSPIVGAQGFLGFDGASLGLRTIKQIDFWYEANWIKDFSIVYVDGAVSGPYGFGKTTQAHGSFVLAPGECITSCVVWHNTSAIASLQLVKNTAQVSAFYGAQATAADPTIFSAGGHALLGLSGYSDAQYLRLLQAVFRHDLRADRFRSVSTATVGVSSAQLFSDLQHLIDPRISRISKIRFRNTAQVIAGLQITYSFNMAGTEVHHETPVRGTDGGATDTWTLGEGENINQVKGRASGAAVYELEFMTDKGNTKKFGQEAGDVFHLEPPSKGMVLCYFMGKSAGYIQSLTFVWGSPPL